VQPEVTTVEELYGAVVDRPLGRQCLIAVEGHSNAGKTTLAAAIAACGSGRLFSTDSYARQRTPRDGRYLDIIDVGRLQDELVAAAAAPLIVLEGICLRDVLAELRSEPHAFVYVKRITPAGLWADDPENYVTNGVPNGDLSWVDRQSVDYHLRESPYELANLIYVRRER
jgi:polynucleotide 5'-kinase involved in rRNA processing